MIRRLGYGLCRSIHGTLSAALAPSLLFLFLSATPSHAPPLLFRAHKRRYDLSLDLTRHDPDLLPHARGMSAFTWSDFALCKWPTGE